MSEFDGMVDYIQSTINDLANINLIRQGKRRKIVTGDYVLFERNYYYTTYDIHEDGGDCNGGCADDNANNELPDNI